MAALLEAMAYDVLSLPYTPHSRNLNSVFAGNSTAEKLVNSVLGSVPVYGNLCTRSPYRFSPEYSQVGMAIPGFAHCSENPVADFPPGALTSSFHQTPITVPCSPSVKSAP